MATSLRLNAKQLKEWREATWLAQGKRCALTGYTISLTEAVADHCHSTGVLRGVIHRGANSVLGKIENSYRRYGMSLPQVFSMGAGLQAYLSKYNANAPIYPTHRTEDEKRIRRNAQARKARAAKKVVTE